MPANRGVRKASPASRMVLLSKTIVIEGEASARSATLLNDLRAELQPVTALHEGIVEDIAASAGNDRTERYRIKRRRYLTWPLGGTVVIEA